MSRVVQMRLRKLEKRRSGLDLLCDEELDNRICVLAYRLIAESVDSGGPTALEEII